MSRLLNNITDAVPAKADLLTNKQVITEASDEAEPPKKKAMAAISAGASIKIVAPLRIRRVPLGTHVRLDLLERLERAGAAIGRGAKQSLIEMGIEHALKENGF